MKEKLIIHPQRCKGCQLCVVACAKGALKIGDDSNDAGYKYVTVDEEKCVKCAMCTSACPDYVFTIEEVQE